MLQCHLEQKDVLFFFLISLLRGSINTPIPKVYFVMLNSISFVTLDSSNRGRHPAAIGAPYSSATVVRVRSIKAVRCLWIHRGWFLKANPSAPRIPAAGLKARFHPLGSRITVLCKKQFAASERS